MALALMIQSIHVAEEEPAVSAVRARIDAAIAGDQRAAGELLRERLPRVRNLVRYLNRGDEHVDDISQQVMVAILRGLPSYRGSGKWESWCDRITARETFAYLKRMRAEHTKRRDAAPELRDAHEAPTRGHDDAYADRRAAIRLLEALPEPQREVLALHHIAGMSMREVSETLGIPTETARSRARLGMQKLRATLSEKDR